MVLAILSSAALPAAAEEQCVTCEEPFAVYRCAFDPQSSLSMTASAAPLVCAKELAQRGGHARCSIRRNASGPCEGELVVVAPSADTQMPVAPPANVVVPGTVPPAIGTGQEDPKLAPIKPIEPAAAPEDASQDVPSKQEEAEAEPKGPPKTVEELAKRTAKSSKKGLEDAGDAVVGVAKKTGEKLGEAGDAIGGAAKSTWRCLSSFFSDC